MRQTPFCPGIVFLKQRAALLPAKRLACLLLSAGALTTCWAAETPPPETFAPEILNSMPRTTPQTPVPTGVAPHSTLDSAPAAGEDNRSKTHSATQPLQPQSVPVLTLTQVLEQVRQYHPKLFGADLERRIAGAKLLEKEGAFDPGISLDSEYLRYNDFTKKGTTSKTWDNELTLNWLTRSGLKLSTGARHNSGDVKPPLYPTGDTGEYFMGARLPLLRGFRMNDKVAAEMQAKIGIPLADAAFQQARLLLLQDAATAYWQWVRSTQAVAIQRQMLDLAKVRLETVQGRVKEGDLPALDAVEAEQEVIRRQGSLIKAERDYQKSVFYLSRYLWQANGTPSPLPLASQCLASMPQAEPLSDDQWMEGRQMALERRPELQALPLQKKIIEVDRDFAKNLRLPVLDLYALPGVDTGDNSIGPTLKAGISLVVPLRQRTARGMQAAAEFKLQKLDLEQRLLLQHVLLEVDDAVSAVQAAYQQIEAARQELDLAIRMEQGERDRFALGDSNLFLVNQRERATAEAALKLLDQQTHYQQAWVALQAVTNQL
ncbi:MAG: TolC family protein [Candidatus Melainabacteria bacterium]|nr:TolC family protein [Candidatus Melainabacteria bacterium]